MTATFTQERERHVRRPGPFDPGRRTSLASLTDAWLSELFTAAGAETGCCLVAVGGYGRGELTAGSDLDLLLLHEAGTSVTDVADRLWYPIWDSGIRLDHSVRTVAQARRLAGDDLTVLLGLLDVRPIAGDATLATALSEAVLRDWRAMARTRLPALRELVEQRRVRKGELATLIEPDLKESYGGLREGTVLRAIAASWVTDIPHSDWEASLTTIWNTRDALHAVSGRSSDVLTLQDQAAVALALGYADEDALLRATSLAARSVAYAADTAWRRVARLDRPPRLPRPLRRGGAARTPLADGVVIHDGEAVLALDADPRSDPGLILRAAAAAAQAGIPMSPVALARLARESRALPEPWPSTVRDALVSLLGSGSALPTAWEALDLAGIIDGLLPEWEVVRSAPQRDPLHRFTVDRHLVETAAHASALTREVDRPDLLLVGALLHDIGKARGGDHSVIGAELALGIAGRMGFSESDARVIEAMVRHHLLLPEVATRRDLDDPATIDAVCDAVSDRQVLTLLRALTEADSRATNAQLWSAWRRELIDGLVVRVAARLEGRPMPEEPELRPDLHAVLAQSGTSVLIGPDPVMEDGLEITVVTDDRLGLLATVAGLLSLHRLQVRAADVMTMEGRAVQLWRIVPVFGSPPSAEQLHDGLRRAVEGSLDVGASLRAREASAHPVGARVEPPPARVETVTMAGARSTVLEVRAHDAAGLLHRIARAIADAEADVTGARVATLGSEVVDVFFLVDGRGAPLTEHHAALVRATVLGAVSAPAARDPR